MPIHNSRRIEFQIESGHIEVRDNAGKVFPAYWAHPQIGQRFSGICLLHDWWGTTKAIRLLANLFARMGYYVVAPDLFNGNTAHTPTQAIQLLEESENQRYAIVEETIDVLESHHRIKDTNAVIGVGMGGSLAFEAACKRTDLEAAIAYAGFPQRYLDQIADTQTPILAIYGSDEPYIKPIVIEALRQKFMQSTRRDHHRIEIIENAAHEFFSDEPDDELRSIGKQVINHTLAFLEDFLEQPSHQSKYRR